MKIKLRRWIKNGKTEAFSTAYEVDENKLKFWVLGRIKVPEFSKIDEMQNWIININNLVEPISGYPEGPVSSSKNKVKQTKVSAVVIKDNENTEYKLTGKKYNWNDKVPKDFSKLQNLLLDGKLEVLSIPTYGSFSGKKKKDMYHYDNICVDHFIAFITYNEDVTFTTDNGVTFDSGDAESEFWEFI